MKDHVELFTLSTLAVQMDKQSLHENIECGPTLAYTVVKSYMQKRPLRHDTRISHESPLLIFTMNP